MVILEIDPPYLVTLAVIGCFPRFKLIGHQAPGHTA